MATKPKQKKKTHAKAKQGDLRLGNQFWMLRSKHGRDRLFETPQLMLEAACEYFQWCIDNPFYEAIVHGKDSKIINVPKMRPFTLQGLTSFMDCNTVYFSHFYDVEKEKDNEISKDFCKVITHIRETIYNQKFSGAASGFLNANIIARDLGIKDSSEVDISNTDGSLTKHINISIDGKEMNLSK
jgi:hypothetical protein